MKAKFKKTRRGNFSLKKDYKTGRTTTVCHYEIKLSHFANFSDDWFDEFSVDGVATYNPNDKFDELFGKRIAESRAKKLVYREVINRFKTEIQSLKCQIKELEDGVKKHEKLLEVERQHFKDILKS